MSQLTKGQLQVENQTNFPNNNTGYITPSLLRQFNDDMIQSLALQSEVDAISSSVDGLIISSSTYATTGSNTFNGNQIINGNVSISSSNYLDIGTTRIQDTNNGITVFDSDGGLQIRNYNSSDLQIDQNAAADLTLTNHLQDIHLYTPSGAIFLNDVDFEQYSASVDSRLNNAQGVQGSTGAQGGTGTQGATGQSIQGSQGTTGTGAQGSIGIQGTTGAQGLVGNQGIQGIKGNQGTQAAQGTIGSQGGQGATGAGTQGADGAQGATGTQGGTGTQGAVGQGVQGTIGSQGVSGSQGGTGTQGSTGAGTQGIQGQRGTQGATGTQGSIGVQGSTGDQGIQGGIGLQGFVGNQGVFGYQGVQGIQGQRGAQGTAGVLGGQGTQGIQGVQGQSIQGIQGPIGSQGSQGITQYTGSFATTGSNTFIGEQTIVGNVTFPSSSFISSTNVSGNLYLASLNGGLLQLNTDGGEGDVLVGSNGWSGKLKVRGDSEFTGSIIVTNSIKGTGSINLQPDVNDARFIEIYNTAATDTHITASGGNLFLGNDETFVLVTTYSNQKEVTIRGDAGIHISGSITSSNDISTSANIYAANLTGSVIDSGSLITTGSAGQTQSITGSLDVRTITTLGLNSTPSTANTGSGTQLYFLNQDINGGAQPSIYNITAGWVMSGNGIIDGIVTSVGGDDNGIYVDITSGNVVNGDSYIGTGPYAQKLIVSGGVFTDNGFVSPGGLTVQNEDGSGGQYGTVSINCTGTDPANIFSALSVNGDTSEAAMNLALSSYSPEYSGKPVPMLVGGGYYTGTFGSSDTAITFYSSSIQNWKPTQFKAPVGITGSLNVSSTITGSTIRLTGVGTTAIQYNQPSTGSVNGVWATSYGKDTLQVYQYQSQPYAFNVNLTANQLAAYTGSEFQWGLQTNGGGSIPGGGTTYFAMSSGSTIAGSGPGADKKGLSYLQTAQIMDIFADTAFRRKVYINNGLMVSASNGSNTSSVIINASVAGGQKALEVTGSVSITGSLSVNGTTIIPSLAAGAFYSTQTQSGSANVSQSMTFNNTDITEGVSVNNNSQLTVANAGTYNIQFSAQIDRVSGSGTDTVYIWLKKNGSVVSNSAGAITVSGAAAAAKAIASWNYVVNANTNDYFELVWQSTDANIQLLAAGASGNIPAIPSVIATVTQVN